MLSGAAWYQPAGQGVQERKPASAVLPSGHTLHAIAPSALYVFPVQDGQALSTW